PGGPAVAAVGREHQANEDRDQRQPADRERVRQLLQGKRDGAGRHRRRIVPSPSRPFQARSAAAEPVHPHPFKGGAKPATLEVDEALAAVDAAEEAGMQIVVLLAAYARGGLERSRQESVEAYLQQIEDLRTRGIAVGLAPHSVRACPADWLARIGRYAADEQLPLHVHADEQPREIEECFAEHGLRPIELLDRTGCLSERTTIV